MCQRALDAGVFVVLPILVLGLAPGAADDGGAVVEDQDISRVAPVRRGAAADIGDEIAGDAFVGPRKRRRTRRASRQTRGRDSTSLPGTAPASAAATARTGEWHPPDSGARDAARGGFWRDRQRSGSSCRAARRRPPSSPPT